MRPSEVRRQGPGTPRYWHMVHFVTWVLGTEGFIFSFIRSYKYIFVCIFYNKAVNNKKELRNSI